MDPETLKKINDLENRIFSLERGSGDSFNRLTSTIDRKVVEDAVSDVIREIVWDDYFYYFSFFESSEAWKIVADGTGSGSIGSGGLQLTSGDVNGNITSANKVPAFQVDLSFDQESRFRFVFREAGSIANQFGYMVVGYGTNRATKNVYGFYYAGDTLYGYVADSSSTSKTLSLLTLTDNDAYNCEARFYPGNKVEFYVSGPIITDGDPTPISRGAISENLPTGEMDSGAGSGFIGFHIETDTAASKLMFVSQCEYIQKKKSI